MLLASAGLTFSFEKIQGMKSVLALGSGMYLDRFVAQEAPGLLVLHGYGNVLQRELAAGESIQVEPGGFLYKDASVTMEIATEKLGGAAAEANQGVQAAKGMATRGLAGLKAARSAMKGGDKIGGLMTGLQAAAGAATGTTMTLMRLTGPGRVGIQSMYMAHETQ